ncbi:hypothetical protein [Emergencia sp. 1XD21-10]|uniref:hypothetical protein n=1 Tax=Emergencia sp. 1XD21-10 TaxID=2304569 RepID=UPI0013796D15|nr:hypothetical protein [Emergencia sp. 1XD21-10]NCE98117.1 hypothetical protein [Emergencia sp. 1XD21-10]
MDMDKELEMELEQLRQDNTKLFLERDTLKKESGKWKKLFIIVLLLCVVCLAAAGCFAGNSAKSRAELYDLRTKTNQSELKEKQVSDEAIAVTKKTAVYTKDEKGEFADVGFLPTYAVIEADSNASNDGYKMIRYKGKTLFIRYEDFSAFQLERNKLANEEEHFAEDMEEENAQ